MEHLVQQLQTFCTEEKLQTNAKLQQLYSSFLQGFPLKKNLNTLPLEKYALGLHEGSFGWWLEYNTSDIGSIKGDSASKHVIYFKKKEQQWSFPEAFQTFEEAWEVLRSDILEIIEHANRDPYEKISPLNFTYIDSDEIQTFY